MEAPTVTLKPDPLAIMNTSSPEPDNAAASITAASKPPMKFMYSSGDRPLDGYTIRRGVGRGGFGEVYFAESDAGKEVAMKLIRRNLDVELRGVRHCLNLKHPNLIALYDIRTDDAGDDWVIMEYVTGPGSGANSLEDVLQQNPTGLSEQDALRWMHGIAAGVSHLHDNGIVHRDLKPGNIFLDGETVKIGDYGLSKFISCSRRSGQTESVGTVHYMAPEIANGRYGREIDTYALGIILYEMLTGHVPFEGESVGEVLMKHLTAEPDLEQVAEPYREIVRRALAKDPDVRLRTVNELVAMLPGGGPGLAGEAGSNAAAVAPAGLLPGDATSPATNPSAPATPRQPDLDEPLWKSLKQSTAHVWSRCVDTHPLLGVLLVMAILACFTLTSWAIIPAALVFYAIYYLVWAAVIRPSIASQATAVAASAPAARLAADTAPHPAPPRQERHRMAAQARRMRLNWREAARKQVAAKGQREKLTELLGSMLFAALVCVGGSLVASILWDSMTDSRGVVVVLWMSIVTTLCAWAALITGKYSEGRFEDQAPMRGIMLACGIGVGLIAGLLGSGLGVDLPAGRDFGPGVNDSLVREVLDMPSLSNSAPITSYASDFLLHSTLYFAGLLMLLRWWRQAEYTRDKRIGFWSVAWVAFFAWVLHLVVWYPQPTAMTVAAIVAVAVQLASPWMPPSKREEVARGGLA